MGAVNPIPAGQPRLTAHLVVHDAADAIALYKAAFGATERFRLTENDGAKIGHAELDIGDTVVMLSDEYPDFGAQAPGTIGGSPVKLHLYVEDVDAAVARAVEAGATLVREPKLEFFGDRVAMVADPFGYSWFLAARIEEVSAEEMQRRWTDMQSGGQ